MYNSNNDETIKKQFSGYLLNAMRYTRSKYLFKLKRIAETELLTGCIPETDGGMETFNHTIGCDFATFSEDGKVVKAMMGLGLEKRKILYLRIFYEMDFSTIAKLVNQPVKKVSATYYNAIKKIRRELRK